MISCAATTIGTNASICTGSYLSYILTLGAAILYVPSPLRAYSRIFLYKNDAESRSCYDRASSSDCSWRLRRGGKVLSLFAMGYGG